MTELIDQITEITEATGAQTETDQFCTAELKQKLAAEQDRVATTQIQIELSTEMNEQLQVQITDLTTAIEQLRDRPTEHASKQTDTLTGAAVQKTAAPQKESAAKGSCSESGGTKEGTRPKEDSGKVQHPEGSGKAQNPGRTAEDARVAGATAGGKVRGMADAGTGWDGEVHGVDQRSSR